MEILSNITPIVNTKCIILCTTIDLYNLSSASNFFPKIYNGRPVNNIHKVVLLFLI